MTLGLYHKIANGCILRSLSVFVLIVCNVVWECVLKHVAKHIFKTIYEKQIKMIFSGVPRIPPPVGQTSTGSLWRGGKRLLVAAAP